MAADSLQAVILRVTVGGDEIVTAALGESMTGVPATPEMRFRNGAVAISSMTTLLLQLVDRGAVGLDDPISSWLPELPHANRVTLRMLANMTAGFPDYVQHDDFEDASCANPFRACTPDELIDIGLSTPRCFAPVPATHRAQIAPDLLGFGALLGGCPNCHTLDETYSYGLGVVLAGRWILHNPLFGGYGALEAHLPAKQIAIAVATTFGEQGFDEQGNNLHARASSEIFSAIGAYLAPDDAPPGRRGRGDRVRPYFTVELPGGWISATRERSAARHRWT